MCLINQNLLDFFLENLTTLDLGTVKSCDVSERDFSLET